MNMKEHILSALMELFNRWEELIAGMTEGQILAPLRPSDWSAKDVIAHLMVWQKRSIARLDAGLSGREPAFPQWIRGLDPDSEGNTDLTNDWIYKTYHDQLWQKVYQDWREGFLHFMELGEGIQERDLLDSSKYPWLGDLPLAVILLSSYDHHQEHFEKLAAWRRDHEAKQATP